jgi:hypothetical protein
VKQCEVTIGTSAFVKIGSRLAPVTVERVIDRGGVRRLKYQCLTGDTGRRIVCTAARLRSAAPAPARPAKPAAPAVDAPTGPGVGTNGYSLTWATPVPGMVANVTAAPVERLTGPNLAFVERTVAALHVAQDWRSACRAVFYRIGTRGRLRAYPRPLRRGLWLAVAETHRANRDLYRHVMGANPVPAAEAVERAMMGDAAARAEVLAQ